MTRPVKLDTDYYVIADDFRLIDFNDNVAARYKGIARGASSIGGFFRSLNEQRTGGLR